MKKLISVVLVLSMVFACACTWADELHMATSAGFPPYEYYEDDKVVGIDAEIAAIIAEKLGMTLVIDDMDFGAIIAAVTTGKADMGMAGMTVTEERLKNVSFSDSYATGIQVVIVKEGSAITSVNDLFTERLYLDIDDIWQRQNGQRQFVTNPNTMIPNDQEGFARFLFDNPNHACRENYICKNDLRW